MGENQWRKKKVAKKRSLQSIFGLEMAQNQNSELVPLAQICRSVALQLHILMEKLEKNSMGISGFVQFEDGSVCGQPSDIPRGLRSR